MTYSKGNNMRCVTSNVFEITDSDRFSNLMKSIVNTQAFYEISEGENGASFVSFQMFGGTPCVTNGYMMGEQEKETLRKAKSPEAYQNWLCAASAEKDDEAPNLYACISELLPENEAALVVETNRIDGNVSTAAFAVSNRFINPAFYEDAYENLIVTVKSIEQELNDPKHKGPAIL